MSRRRKQTLSKVIGSLPRLTGQPVTPNDLLESIETPAPEELDLETQHWLDASAAEGLKHLHRLERDQAPEAVAAWLEAFQSAGTPVKFPSASFLSKGGAFSSALML